MRQLTGNHSALQAGQAVVVVLLIGLLGLLAGRLVVDSPILTRGIMALLVAFVLAWVMKPSVLMGLIVVSIPFFGFDVVDLSRVSGIMDQVPFTISHALGALLALSFFLRYPTRDVGARRLPVPLVVGLVALLIAYLVSATGVGPTRPAQIEYVKTVANFVAFGSYAVVAVMAMAQRERFMRLLKIWLVTAFAVALGGIYQVATFYTGGLPALPLSGNLVYYGELPRAMSILPEPTMLAAYLSAPLWSMAVAHSYGLSLPFKSSSANVAVFGIVAVASILTFSPLGAITVGLAFMGIPALRLVMSSALRPRRVVLVMLVPVVLLISPIGGAAVDRLSENIQLTAGSSVDRLNQVTVGLKALSARPIAGVGAGNFEFVDIEGALASRAFYSEGRFATSTVVNLMAELGTIGILAILVFFSRLFMPLKRLAARSSLDPATSHVTVVLIAALAADTLTGFVLTSAGGWYSFPPWTLYALVAAWPLIVRSEAQLKVVPDGQSGSPEVAPTLPAPAHNG